MDHDGDTFRWNGQTVTGILGQPLVYSYPIQDRYDRWYAGDQQAFNSASEATQERLWNKAKSDWTWIEAAGWFAAGLASGIEAVEIAAAGTGYALYKWNKGGKNSTSTPSYKPPTGGGGVTYTIQARGRNVTLGHGARHLEGTGLKMTDVNMIIAHDVSFQALPQGQFY